jgi:hypothetical protein
MRIPARFIAFHCFAMSLLTAGSGALCAEPMNKGGTVPVVAEIIYAPTDLAKLKPRVNHRVVLEGVIVATGKSRTGSTSYLNFTKNYRDSVSLVFLGASVAKDFPKERLAEFVGRKIHVGGLLEERSGALQMRVFDAEQIKVLK